MHLHKVQLHRAASMAVHSYSCCIEIPQWTDYSAEFDTAVTSLLHLNSDCQCQIRAEHVPELADVQLDSRRQISVCQPPAVNR